MKYNSKYDRWVTKGGLVYRYNKIKDKFVMCKCTLNNGYEMVSTRCGKKLVHRVVYETFVGDIPQGYQIDHINTIRDDNRLENIRCVTVIENNNNPLTKIHKSESQKGKQLSEETRKKMSESHKGKPSSNKGKYCSDFGRKFKEHFGINHCENPRLYNKEYLWYIHHNKTCSWEMNTDERN